jgi:hypothetical protein
MAACLAASGCGGASKDQPETPRPPVLGVTAGALLVKGAPLASEVQTMAASGVSTLRAPIYWSLMQPRRGAEPNFATTDKLVEAASRDGITLLPVVLGTPSWAALHPRLVNSPPAGSGAYGAFLRKLIARYGPHGSFWSQHEDVPKRPLRAWQIWNEPSHVYYWSDQPFARAYVRLARGARKAIKAADPGALVVMAGFPDRSWDSLAQVYRAGAKGVFDVDAVHPYTFEVRNVLRIVVLARRTLRRFGDGNRPLWLTEVTWSSGKEPGHRPAPFETTPQDQAARLSRAIPLLLRERRRLGVQRIYWESWISTDRDHANPFNFSGLRELRPDGTVKEKPAFPAFKRVALDFQSRSGG